MYLNSCNELLSINKEYINNKCCTNFSLNSIFKKRKTTIKMNDVIANLYMNGAVELSCVIASLFVLYKVVSSIDSFVFSKVLIIAHNS